MYAHLFLFKITLKFRGWDADEPDQQRVLYISDVGARRHGQRTMFIVLNAVVWFLYTLTLCAALYWAEVLASDLTLTCHRLCERWLRHVE